MKTVAIIGVGLIGGSLGRALRRTRQYRVIGIGRRSKTLQQAKRLGAIDTASTRFEGVRNADIVVIATPIRRIAAITKVIRPYLKPNAVVTDVGSVKGAIIQAVPRSLPFVPGHPAKSPYFVGAHPLAGSHKTGVEWSSADLFRRAPCVIIPPVRGSIEPVVDMWRRVGAIPIKISAGSHDTAVALISHLPHVLAHAMVHTVLSHPKRRFLASLLAGSFRDVTRVASSDPAQWSEILSSNAPAVRQAIRRFRNELRKIEEQLDHPALQNHLRASQKFRLPLFRGV